LRTILWLVVLAVVLVLVIGWFVPPDRTNPAINPAATFEAVAKPSPELAAIVQRACYDCHSNTTVWPWYGRIAPISWLIADDVKKGRAHLNFSEWANYGPEMAREKLRNACTEATAGEMPLWQYRLIHPLAKLSEDDVKSICAAATQIPGQDGKK
jgi:hypothetical protein